MYIYGYILYHNTYIEPRKISTLELLVFGIRNFGVCMRFCAKKKNQDRLGAGGFIGFIVWATYKQRNNKVFFSFFFPDERCLAVLSEYLHAWKFLRRFAWETYLQNLIQTAEQLSTYACWDVLPVIINPTFS